MTVQKFRGRRHNGELVEFGWEDLGRLGKSYLTSVHREGRDAFDITSPAPSSLGDRLESDIVRIVAFFGLKRETLEHEVDGTWAKLEPEAE